jgi:trk system potassium uptake protein TrkA
VKEVEMGHVIIVGGGRIGTRLAGLLIESGSTVHVVEPDADRAAALEARFGPGIVIRGSGTSPEILERAGIHACDVVASVSGTDEVNLVSLALARFTFGVDRTIGRVNDPRNAWMFHRDLGVDAAVDQADLLSHLIAEEMSLGDMTILLALRRGRYALVEERVGAGATVAGHAVASLDLPPECVLLAVIRQGTVVPAHGDLVIQPGDDVLAIIHTDRVHHLADLIR